MEIITKVLNDNNDELISLILFDDYNENFCKLIEKEIKKPILLISFINTDWNVDFSPWAYDKFSGYGNNTINKALNIIKENKRVSEDIYVAGYSLGGLLALYSLTISENIKCCASCSGSMWYPNLIEYLNDHLVSNKNIYLSLGDKEAKTKHPLMSQVDNKTQEVYELLKKNNAVFFEYNQGNHFFEAEKRLLKGIKYLFK